MIPVTLDGAGGLAHALAAGMARLGWVVDRGTSDHVVMLASGDVQAMLNRIRTRGASAIVLIVDESALTPLDTHVLLAAVEPLAIAAAPGGRLGAVAVGTNADPADVAAAVNFLLRAPSVTGQIIRIDPSVLINC